MNVTDVNLNKSISLFERFKSCLALALLPVLSLVVYMGLRSTQIYPDGSPSQNLWHSAYIGWYDFFLAYSIALSLVTGAIKLYPEDILFVLILSLIILLSFLNGIDLGTEYILDTLVYLFRFILTFYLAKGLVHRLGTQTTESILIALFIILAISALFVYQLQFGKFNRIYAAGMTVASFSQVTTVVCFIAFLRQYKRIIVISLIFLLLTFSRTSTLLLIILFLAYSRKLPILKTLKYYTIITIFAVVTFSILLNFGGDEFVSLIAERTDTSSVSTLNSRDEIWGHALKLLESGYIPLFGIGFHATPSLIVSTNLSFKDTEGLNYFPPHFHSIFIEYGFGLGILSLIIFFYLIRRIWQTFYHHCYPSFFIFAFFLMSQAVDYTFYQPKQVIIWALMLGLAEGQWRFEHG